MWVYFGLIGKIYTIIVCDIQNFYLFGMKKFQNLGETKDDFHSSKWIWFNFYCQIIFDIFMKFC